MNRLINIIILYLIVSILPIKAQDFASLPKLVPSYSEDFSDYHSYPSICFREVFFDLNGKMWVLPCGALRNMDAIHLFQFDGYDFKFVGGDWEKLAKRSRFAGIYQKNQLVGLVRSNEISQLFFFDLHREKLRLIDFESEGHLEFVTLTEDNRIFLVTEKENTLFFYEWTEEALLPQGQFSIPKALRSRIIQSEGLFLNEEEFWFKKNKSNFILRIHKKTGKAQKITATDFPANSVDTTLIVNRITEKEALPGNEFYVYRELKGRRTLYKMNLATDRLEQVEGIPAEWNIESIAIDQTGNKLFLFEDEKEEYKSILQTIDGKQFDYSALFEPLNGIRVSHFQSEDFREKIIICHNRGLLLQQVKTTDAIQYFMPSYQIRDMAELPDNKLIIGTHIDGFFLLDPQKAIVEPFRIPGCPFAELPTHTNLTTDSTGNIWYNTHTDFIKYNPENNNCTVIPLEPRNIAFFSFVGADQIAIFDRQNFLYLYDLKSQRTSPFLVSNKPFKIKGRIQDLYYDNNDGLWVATNDGLVKIDLSTRAIETFGKEPPFRDYRMVCIDPDENGRLWLGTSLRGLQIFDPNSGDVSVMNNEQGLSNNTVISILKDDDGDRWLATYNGISIVDKNGQVVANLTEEDGLMEKENNRYSKLKAKDGKLLFGTIRGLHVIDPQEVKNQLKQTKNLKVYLTALEYYNPENKADVQYTNRLNDINAVKLQASKRYLNLKFALSNYFKPEENQYAYMLKGLDEGWTDLGNQRALSLNNLPAGRYELLIKGSDATGNWSQEPLSLSIYAKEFFYKKTWFSLLVFFSLLLFVGGTAWLWIRRLRSEVRKATSKIRQDKEVIERQAEQLKDIDKAKSIFFTNISHEFRTPLTVISGMAGRLKRHLEARQEHSYDMILRNSNNLLNLVNQILDLRKLESGKLDVDLIQADVIPYLRYIFESFESLARNKDIAVHLLMDEEELVMDHDKKKILRIVSNLLSNAIKFTPEGGDVYFIVNTLGVLETPRVLTIKIKDTGIGIPPEKLPHIFERFYQVDGSSTRSGEGTGIGLSLCKELVTLLDGTIQVTSEVNKGTVFTVSLPITQNAPLSDNTNEVPLTLEAGVTTSDLAIVPKPIEMVNPNTELPLILLVEDNTDVIQYLITCLENQHRLLIARDGQEGIEKAIESVPDAIISDVMMPRKDGFELCHTLKTDERTSHIPIILLTAKADVDSRISGLKRGADDYLTKPFNEEELLTRLENQMQIRRTLQLHFLEAKPLPPSLGKNIQQENEFLQKIRQDIEAHLDEEDYGILQICQMLAMSRSQVHRKVKALTGQSTSIFIRSIRLHKAKEFLETTDLNVSQVAYEVGFRHPSYFTRSFVEEFGVSPNEVKK